MSPRTVVARAPGRVNLIGEHTDYNDGFVLPMALPFDTTIRLTERDDRVVNLRSDGFADTTITIDDDPRSVVGWARYVAGMIDRLGAPGGFDAEVSTTIPIGASLSSSAALEVATGFALCAMAGAGADPSLIARAGQWVENEVIGIQSGIMDQLISAAAVEGHALMVDCRSLETRAVQLPAESTVVIMDTMTRRELAESAYDERRAACERSAEQIGVSALRDASIDQLSLVTNELDQRRARHVIGENLRVQRAVEALSVGDAARFGSLMNESHESLRVDHEVSSMALDCMVELARESPACLGARMTGGGFAGCAVALVERDRTEAFLELVRRRYDEECGIVPDLWAVDPGAGASVEVL
ncbi:MAG: galactokinase [Acidimicrobiales bacterium]